MRPPRGARGGGRHAQGAAPYVDASASGLEEVVVNGGRRGLQIALHPADLVAVTSATVLELRA